MSKKLDANSDADTDANAAGDAEAVEADAHDADAHDADAGGNTAAQAAFSEGHPQQMLVQFIVKHPRAPLNISLKRHVPQRTIEEMLLAPKLSPTDQRSV